MERCVLGSLLFGCDDERLSGDHFYGELHRAVYHAIRSLQSRGSPVDGVTVVREMQAHGDIHVDQCRDRWVPELLKIMETVPVAQHIRHYTDLLIDLYRRRRLMRASEYLERRARDMTADVDETWERVRKATI